MVVWRPRFVSFTITVIEQSGREARAFLLLCICLLSNIRNIIDARHNRVARFEQDRPEYAAFRILHPV